MKKQIRIFTAFVSLLAISVSGASFFSESLGPSNLSLKLYINFSAVNRTAVTDFSAFGNNGTFSGGVFNDGDYIGEALNNGTVSGATWNASGKYGNALSFHGNSDNVAISPIELRSRNLTVAAWINLNNDSNVDHLFLEDNSTPTFGAFINSQGRLVGFIRDGSSVQLTNTTQDDLRDGFWHHVAMSFNENSKTSQLFVDGALKNTTTHPSFNPATIPFNFRVIGASTRDGNVAASPAPRDFNGTIDEFRVYQRILNGTEINQTMNNEMLRDGLLNYWRMDEGAGATAFDTHHIAYSSNLDGSKYGNALTFDGVDDYASIKNNSMVFERTNQITVTAWIYSYGSSNTQGIVTKIDGNSPFAGWGLIIFSGQENILNFALVNTNNANEIKVNSTIPVPKNEWVHVAATYDGSSNAGGATLYINGINRTAIFKNTLSGSIYNNIQESIGSYGGQNRFFNGSIDNVRIFNRSLTGEEINETMLSERPPAISGLLSSWDLDEASGSRLYDENNIRWTPYSKGMHFDGADDYLSVSAASFNETNGSMTGWMNPANVTSANDQPLIGNPSVARGLVAWWDFNGNVLDKSGSGYDGTVKGATATTDGMGQGAKAYSFSGTDQNISTKDITQLNSASAFTVTAWALQTTANTQGVIWAKRATDTNKIDLTAWNDGFDYVDFATGAPNINAKFDNSVIASGVWFHSAVVFDGTASGDANRLKVYINGIQRPLTFIDGRPVPATTANLAGINFEIGTNAANDWNGKIDDVRVYDRALSPDEINATYNSSAGLRVQSGHLIFDTGDSWLKYNVSSWSGWHHVAGVYNGTRAALFADGTEVNSTDDRSLFTFPVQAYAGGTKASSFNGTIDEARIYSAMLTGSEIRQLYSCGFPIAPAKIWDVSASCNVAGENLANSALNLTVRGNGNFTLSATNLTVNRAAIEIGSRIAIDALSSLRNVRRA